MWPRKWGRDLSQCARFATHPTHWLECRSSYRVVDVAYAECYTQSPKRSRSGCVWTDEAAHRPVSEMIRPRPQTLPVATRATGSRDQIASFRGSETPRTKGGTWGRLDREWWSRPRRGRAPRRSPCGRNVRRMAPARQGSSQVAIRSATKGPGNRLHAAVLEETTVEPTGDRPNHRQAWITGSPARFDRPPVPGRLHIGDIG